MAFSSDRKLPDPAREDVSASDTSLYDAIVSRTTLARMPSGQHAFQRTSKRVAVTDSLWTSRPTVKMGVPGAVHVDVEWAVREVTAVASRARGGDVSF